MSRAAALPLWMSTHHRAGTSLQRKLLPALPGEPLHLALGASTNLHSQLRCFTKGRHSFGVRSSDLSLPPNSRKFRGFI